MTRKEILEKTIDFDDAINRIVRLEKENAELKAFINAPLIKGRRTTRKEFYQTIWDLSGQLTKAKFLLKQLVDAFPKSYSDVVKDTLDEARKFVEE